ncbi:MAG: ATP-binding protein [Prevotella sp.]|nr:ATP-binding protein [Prevotella sp.]
MYIKRIIAEKIAERMQPNRAVLIFGARRVGKTMLIKQITDGFAGKTMMLNGDDMDIQALLGDSSIANYQRLFSDVELLVIDEAQNIPDIGKKLKLIVDEIPGIKVIASGSSSFDLKNKTGEPLVGRATQFFLTPFSQAELSQTENVLDTRRNIETRLIYGSYPDVVLAKSNVIREEYLRDLVDAYLLKDILSIDGLKNSSKMRDLLRLLSYQTGSEVSYDELGRQTGMSRNTVERYLDLLSKVYVIYRIGGFSRNLRKEVAKAGKWYFYDLGVRNAVINNFSPLAIRQDTGAIWENYIISERMKRNYNLRLNHELFFWKTYDRQEIDLVESASDMSLEAFEIKWGDKHPKCPVAFANAYPDATFTVLNRDNYIDYIT